jgi:2-keto-4-pentenoate hydratase/2-oxohepta-3-ene-1,7-dioic acid hydratase in catechol pathway
MRLVTFRQGGVTRLGAVIDDQVLDLVKRASETNVESWPDDLDMTAFLRLGPFALEKARRVVAAVERGFRIGGGEWLTSRGVLRPLKAVKLMAPVPNPSKIIAIGLNYRDHAREQKEEIPDRPIIFAKFSTSVIGPGAAITWDPALTAKVDYEAELAFVVGRVARNVRPEDAYGYIAGYTCVNDVSARDLQFGDKQWVRGKSLDTFCPMGPALVTVDEVPNPHRLGIRAVLNGRVMQDSNTRRLIFGVPELLAFISRAFTLLPGDVVATGTPRGVGVFRKPPVFLKHGDKIAIEIDGIGRLENVCRTVKGPGSA